MIHTLILLLSIANTVFYAKVQDETPCNCCSHEHQQFNFWIGDWEVYDTTGAIVGHNSITKIQTACALRESWVGASGFTGTSLNYFNDKTEKWHQVWVDQSGNVLNLSGTFGNNSMSLISEEIYNKKAEKWYQNRIVWTKNEDKTVRQVWETTLDKGITWNIVFDGLYKKTM